MVEEGIIDPIRYSSSISNPVIVHKNIGHIRICVDFINLNQASLKDNYPLLEHGVPFAKGHRRRNDVHA
jgi:hypothetical protein